MKTRSARGWGGAALLALTAGALGVWFVYDAALDAIVAPPRGREEPTPAAVPSSAAGFIVGASAGTTEGGVSGLAAGDAASGPDSIEGRREALSFLHVEPGEGFASLSRRLVRMGSVRSSWPLRWEARRKGWDRSVAPGWYRYRRGETVRELLARLGRGEIEQVRLTIPEGWRLERILATLADSTWVPLDSLRGLAGDRAWLAEMELPGPGLEGFAFPETYWIPRGVSPRQTLEPLVRQADLFWHDSLATAAHAAGLDRRELWTLASIIEAEAARPEERAHISAVFWNRLRRGMRLESDPTVLFALGRPPGPVRLNDLAVDSPYNTYRSAGLPPGPICSPGRASLLAALHPRPGCADLFFVARGDGSHVFSRSLAEHNQARRVLRSRQAAARTGKRR